LNAVLKLKPVILCISHSAGYIQSVFSVQNAEQLLLTYQAMFSRNVLSLLIIILLHHIVLRNKNTVT